jgi:hypothetical protein
VRIPSWLPFTVHVCVNGREWLRRQLQQRGTGFLRSDHGLLRVDDLAEARQLLPAQPRAGGNALLGGLLARSCPALLQLPLGAGHHEYDWPADETEWAAGVMFRSPDARAALDPPLLRHALTTFSSRDVMRFLGRTRRPAAGGVDLRGGGQVVSDRLQEIANCEMQICNLQFAIPDLQFAINGPSAPRGRPDAPRGRFVAAATKSIARFRSLRTVREF